MRARRPVSVQEEVEAFIAWLYENDYVIAWPIEYGHFEAADEKERKQIVETYLRGYEANSGRK